jgi:gas vesicle structural protein
MTPEELYEEVTLVDLLDRVLDKGVVVAGDITLSVADVDLVYVGLRLLVSSASTAQRFGAPVPGGGAIEKSATGSSATQSSALGSAALDSTATDNSGTDDDPFSSSPFESETSETDALDSELGFPGGQP